jgi:hypothetical protein
VLINLIVRIKLLLLCDAGNVTAQKFVRPVNRYIKVWKLELANISGVLFFQLLLQTCHRLLDNFRYNRQFCGSVIGRLDSRTPCKILEILGKTDKRKNITESYLFQGCSIPNSNSN